MVYLNNVNPYENNCEYQFIEQQTKECRGKKVEVLTYRMQHGSCWKLARIFALALLTLCTFSGILRYPFGQKLWAEAKTGHSLHQYERVVPDGPNMSREAITFEQIVSNSAFFAKKHGPFSTAHNLAAALGTNASFRREIAEHAKGTRPLMHERVRGLVEDFLKFKLEYGSKLEKKLYSEIVAEGGLRRFIDRLLTKRPLMFMNASDEYLLRTGEQGSGGFTLIGTDKETAPLVLSDYMSYDEMELAALIAVSVPTHFINAGGYGNDGKKGEPGSYEERGIIIGLAGARFEMPEHMEYRFMKITQIQNTKENGYGKESAYFAHWAKFYGISHFPTYEEASSDSSGRFIQLQDGSYLDAQVYKERIRISAETLLFEANQRAKIRRKKAFVQVAGLGLNAWGITSEQVRLSLEVYAETIKRYALDHISDISFTTFTDQARVDRYKAAINIDRKAIRLHFPPGRNPAAKLTGHEAGKLLVMSYAWDGNSYPGNEYWVGALNASGDPRAASCSNIPELQNPEINPQVCGNNFHIVSPKSGKIAKIEVL